MSLYLLIFLILAHSILVSKLHVNSNNSMCFFFLSIITRSGLEEVHKTSGGNVLPFSQNSGMSEKSSSPSGIFFLRFVDRWLSTELCRQVNLPSDRAFGHQLSMCCRLLGFLHKTHLLVFLIPQRFRLSGVLRPFEQAFNVNDNTPLVDTNPKKNLEYFWLGMTVRPEACRNIF